MTETVELKPWPLGGYAPGDYSCVCGSCQKEFVGDKRAWQCLECAAIAAKSALTRSDPAVRDRVKQLEWKEDKFGAEAPSAVGRYMVEDMGANWLDDRYWLQCDRVIGKFGTASEAKAAAQADYEQRILSALEPSTSPVRDKVTDEMVEVACATAASTYATYPDRDVSAHLSDWFDLNAQDAVDFKVLHTPEWHYYSDIRGEQFEQYIAAVLREPIRAALTAALTRSPE